jgi:acyl transferase domain-containing protein/Zn-dependent alcohol dehydrogenase/acyl carrier protein/short-subunit dehydrogenase
LLQGQNFITQADSSRWSHAEFLHPDKAHPGTAYTFAAGTLGDISGFDAEFFSISPREAASIDPQQRILLELTWELFENAGIKASTLRGSDCGVYLGVASIDHAYRITEDLGAVDAGSATGNTSSIVANRLSYFYDLRGPSMTVDTACSSSLVAFHQACQAIASGDISQAVTGGISLHLHPFGFLVFSKASMLSRTGQCHVFDESADGYVRSEGGGLFLLKDYDQALADGNPILAVVGGSAVNTDGRKSSLTLPSAEAQMALMTQAYQQAGISPEQIDYLEAHGTGTPVGDPIETRAIGQALGQKRSRALPIGSVKSNIGHLEAASGVAGLTKALLTIMHRQVPATVGINRLNPAIDFTGLNLDVVQANRPLKAEGELIVGINSFGFGGANAHVILRSAEATPAPAAAAPQHAVPLLLSARNAAGLAANAQAMADYLAAGHGSLYDAAWHSLDRRDALGQRLVVIAADAREAAQALADYAADPSLSELASVVESGQALDAASAPAWVFSGNGSQWQGMGRALLADPVFAAAVAEVDALFQPQAGYSLHAELAGALAGAEGEDRYASTEFAQPALFALQVGVVHMLRARGLEPQAVVGHSVGEVAAAWACGALSLADATLVIYQRSRLQGLTRGTGQMSAVGLGAEAIAAVLDELNLGDEVVIAGENSGKGATLAGSVAALDRLEAVLNERQIFVRRLALDYAFHSPCMNPIHQPVLDALAAVRPQAARIPFYSTVTGGELSGERLGAEYWWHNIRHPVLFQGAVDGLVNLGVNTFVEVGPHPILRSYVVDALNAHDRNGAVVATLLRNDHSPALVDRTLAKLLIAGVPPTLPSLFPVPGQWLRLPNYAWQRERHWHALTPESGGTLQRSRVHPLLGYALPQQGLAWENRLDTALFPTLGDHQVGEAVLFPGAGFTELALAAALLYQPGEFVDIEELEIHAPLILSAEHSKKVQVRIAEADGALSIRSRTTGEREEWVQHVVARLPGDACGVMLDRVAPALPARAADFSGAQHLQLTEAVGLNYGPAYQAVSEGWRLEQGILARLQVPAAIDAEIDDLHVHPALLDSAFQLITQLLAHDPARRTGLAFIPVKFGRVAFTTRASVPVLAQVQLVKASEHSLLADFTLFDAQGQAVVHIKDARFRGVRLQRDRAGDIKQVTSVAIPMPTQAPLAAAPAPALQPLLQGALAELHHDPQVQRYVNEVEPLLDSLCSRFVSEWLTAQGGHLSAERLAEYPGDSQRWVARLLAQGEEDGSLQRDAAGRWQVVAEDDGIRAQDIWQELLRSYPEHFQLIHSVGRIGTHLAELSSGARPLAELLPRETSTAALARVALGAAAYHAMISALQQHIGERLAALAPGERLRILELGQQGRPLAASLLAQLDFDRVDYLYCATQLDAIELLQGDYPELQALTLADARQAPQGVLQGFDLLLLATDLAPLANLAEGLQFASARLRDQAQVLLLAQHPARWADFIFAAEPSWWMAGQGPAAATAQQRPAFWQQELQRLGLDCQAAVELTPGTAAGAYWLLAQSAKPAAPLVAAMPAHNWLLVGDSALAADLDAQLTAAGQRVRRVAAEQSAALDDAQHVVLLAGLDDARGLAMQPQRCLLAAHWAQACEAQGRNAHLWLLTRGAASHLQPVADAGVDSIADAALWGFGRTLANESAQCQVRLLDLAPGTSAAALLPTLLGADRESEMAVDAHGQRFVPRLRLLDSQTPAASTGNVRLGFEMPGQLRNLRWECRAAPQPAADQLAVAVRATGLNFRDVMYALGLLSDEAIENGFSGPTLGFEFAGVVTAMGAEAQGGFQPGDRVVGFGPSSFANSLVTNANAVARIPAGMSFEAAATIPSTFFTVYYALHHLARLEPGEKVLIHGAAGGVGIAAIQIAKWCGAEIYATAGSDEKRDFLRLMGVQHIYDSRSLAYADQILADTAGRGVDVVLNSLAGEAINRNFQVLKPFGRFLELGKRDFYQNTRIGLRPFRNNISYFGIDADQLMSERPDLTRRLFAQMMALFEQGVLSPLPYHEFDANEVVEAFRYMQQARQIGKVVVTYRNPIQQPVDPRQGPAPMLQLDPHGCYMVTGGLGGFGLRTAHWLVAKGARHLVLLSRRGAASEEAQPALAAWREQGIGVQALACDLADPQQLAQVFAGLAAGAQPLRGVVHAATVIDDGLIRNLDAAQMQRVLVPKALGAQHLDALTRDLSLDFFVMFSSATTLFGNPGQANYVAANHWLEALARRRLALGLPATAVLWGAIDDAGFLARNQDIKQALQGRMGGSALMAAAALERLEHMLLKGRSGLGVLELDWKALSRFLPSAQAPRFRELARLQGGEQDEEGGQDIQRMLEELDDEALQAAFGELLKQEISEILRLPASKLDSQRPLQELGLDSLMSVELVVAVEDRFGIRLPVMELSESSSIAKLSVRILELLRGNSQAEAAPDAMARDTLARHGVDLDSEQGQQMLAAAARDQQPS